jgi:hypothetical protein
LERRVEREVERQRRAVGGDALAPPPRQRLSRSARAA